MKIGYGLLTSFWEDTWVRDSLLRLRFPKLFHISNQTNKFVMEGESCIFDLK